MIVLPQECRSPGDCIDYICAQTGFHTLECYSVTCRFAATLGELTGGRVGLTCGSVGVLKGAVTIAVRFAIAQDCSHDQH